MENILGVTPTVNSLRFKSIGFTFDYILQVSILATTFNCLDVTTEAEAKQLSPY
jgi:hypothetical protein